MDKCMVCGSSENLKLMRTWVQIDGEDDNAWPVETKRYYRCQPCIDAAFDELKRKLESTTRPFVVKVDPFTGREVTMPRRSA